MSLSKKTRFEIFKRDGFTCQYCGRRPPEVVLEVDHIDPSSKGGSDEELNLVTSCFDCNRGKSDRRLSEARPRPDADLCFLETQQELVEAERFLASKERLLKVREKVLTSIRSEWSEYLTPRLLPSDQQIIVWLDVYSPEEIEFAIRRTHGKFESGDLHGNSAKETVSGCYRYISGILRGEKNLRSANG